MPDAFLAQLYRRFRLRSLSGKLLLPLVSLMLVSLLGSTLAFVVGTALTRNQLLAQQVTSDAEQVTQGLEARVDTVINAASLLANDPEVLKSLAEEEHETGASGLALNAINSRAVVIRDRLGVDLVQIYDDRGQARANLVMPALYRETSLLDQVPSGRPAVRFVGGRPLLLYHAAMPDGSGAVVAGVDLETELARLSALYRLVSELALEIEGGVVTTAEMPVARDRGHYAHQVSFTLGGSDAQLELVRSTADIAHVTGTGLRVMIGSALLTMMLVTCLGVLLTRSIARPIERLSAVAGAVARGDLLRVAHGARDGARARKQPYAIGSQDEIGLLETAFDTMVSELRDLYGGLEAKVQARTHELATAAEVARSVSSSLNIEVITRRSVELIYDRLRFHSVALYFLSEDGHTVALKEAIGADGCLVEVRQTGVPLEQDSLIGIAAAAREPRIVHDLSTLSSEQLQALCCGTCCVSAIPLLTGDALIGILEVQSAEPDRFAPETIGLLLALADHVATGLHNARLYGRQRETADRLAEVDRLKDQFLANMSHEMRTPLNAIIGFSRMLLKEMSGPLTETQVEDISNIHDSGRHMLALINDLLDLSRINAGEMELVLEEADIAAAIEAAMGATLSLIAEKPVTVRAEVEPDLEPVVADRRRIHQVLLNLLSNAAKFTERGEIVIRACMTEMLDPRTETPAAAVQVSVRDTGIGIPPAKFEDIFKEFVQADNTESRRFQGSGLGLPIARKLVELHGGHIWVESRVGHGSTFTFVLSIRGPVRGQIAEIIEEKPYVT